MLVSNLLEAVAKAWASFFDPRLIDQSTPRLSAGVLALSKSYGEAAAVHSVDFYKQQRFAARVVGRFTVPLAPSPQPAEVSAQVRWAVSNLYGPVTPEKTDATLTKVQGVATKIVLDQSRDTLLGAVKKDPRARGWARVPEPGACSFCLLLATRGAVYKTKTTFDRSNAQFTGEGQFKVHDHCACNVEPLFADHYEPTAAVRAAEALYKASARTGPSDPLNNFRTALQRERDAGRFAG